MARIPGPAEGSWLTACEDTDYYAYGTKGCCGVNGRAGAASLLPGPCVPLLEDEGQDSNHLQNT